MSELFNHHSLKKHNSFGLEVSCRYFFNATTLPDLYSFFKDYSKTHRNFMILGEGSNVLFTRDFDGTIIHPDLKGLEVISEDVNAVHIRAMAGENWDGLVKYCVENDWSGLENLSLIPGSVGSSPVQNIGAYGVEAKDSIIAVEGFFIETGELKTFANEDCLFAYRNSIFKQELKNRFLITSVLFSLKKNHRFDLGYGPVEKEFLKKPIQDLASLRETIIEIRESKLPDPVKLGNAGSFFKNPVIPVSEFNHLQTQFPEIPSFPAGEDTFKIPAAWLIEKAGWKGVRKGNTGTYPSQPLVIINYGDANGTEIYTFAKSITDSIFEKFGIQLEMEVKLF